MLWFWMIVTALRQRRAICPRRATVLVLVFCIGYCGAGEGQDHAGHPCPPRAAEDEALECSDNHQCGDYHPGMTIRYGQHPLSLVRYETWARESGMLEVRAWVIGALCRWRYTATVTLLRQGSEVGVERSLPLQVARHGESVEIIASFPAAEFGGGGNDDQLYRLGVAVYQDHPALVDDEVCKVHGIVYDTPQ